MVDQLVYAIENNMNHCTDPRASLMPVVRHRTLIDQDVIAIVHEKINTRVS